MSRKTKQTRRPKNRRGAQEVEFSSTVWRFRVVKIFILIGFLVVIGRLAQLGIGQATFLQKQSDARSIRVIKTPAVRGMITDRNNQPLAVSTVVMSAWSNPKVFHATRNTQKKLIKLLDISQKTLDRRVIHAPQNRQFAWLKRSLPPDVAYDIKALHIPGVFFQREYHRFYPQGPITAQLVGITNIDQQGQEGLELAYNKWLSGVPGKQRVIKDRRGDVIMPLEEIEKPEQGQPLSLSIDYRIQYLSFQALQQAVKKYQAASGSIVVLNPKTGEVLAMASFPSYNPNNRVGRHDGRYRNRAVTDVFEPGSTMKVFSLMAGLESGKFTPETKIDTNPGRMKLDGHTILDEHVNHGVITFSEVLQKSSNVGVAKVILKLSEGKLMQTLGRFGFGARTQSNFPGEASGFMSPKSHWGDFELATLGFGYAITTTPLQLAHAYGVIANHGKDIPVTMLKRGNEVEGFQTVDRRLADQMIHMLESVVEPGGTGWRAAIPGYKVAGKTATAQIAGNGGYLRHSYNSSFVGFVPSENARLVVSVVLNKPKSKAYFGGLIAAPVFAQVARGALRILNIPPEGSHEVK